MCKLVGNVAGTLIWIAFAVGILNGLTCNGYRCKLIGELWLHFEWIMVVNGRNNCLQLGRLWLYSIALSDHWAWVTINQCAVASGHIHKGLWLYPLWGCSGCWVWIKCSWKKPFTQGKYCNFLLAMGNFKNCPGILEGNRYHSRVKLGKIVSIFLFIYNC